MFSDDLIAAIPYAGESQCSEGMAAMGSQVRVGMAAIDFSDLQHKKSQNSFVEDRVAIDAHKPMAAIPYAGESQCSEGMAAMGSQFRVGMAAIGFSPIFSFKKVAQLFLATMF